MPNFEELYYYSETSPSFLRRKTTWASGKNLHIIKALPDDPAGHLTLGRCTYWNVKCGNTSYKAHRVIWELFNGVIPGGMQIDHFDGNSLNNNINNLRMVTNKTNARSQKFRSTNTSKVCGVGLLVNKKKSGENRYWKAQWNDLDGKRTAKCFSIATYGDEDAFRLACAYREKMIAELNAQGAGYTDTHGKR